MAIIHSSMFQIAERPELIIGLAAAVGCPLMHVQRIIENELRGRRYDVYPVRFSELIEAVDEPGNTVPAGGTEYLRIRHLMRRGDAIRERLGGGDALAVLAAAEIAGYRQPEDELPVLEGHAFVLRQLKHPAEVATLRLIYGDRFHLVGVYAPETSRLNWLRVTYGMTESEARDLVDTDEGEPGYLGQQLRDTFHLADVFVSLPDPNNTASADAQIRRYMSLVFSNQADGLVTPTREEFGMFMAYNASLRSADLSRQVGAAIMSSGGDLIAVGCNEVPASGGGQYWADGEHEGRDFARGGDANALRKPELLDEILSALDKTYSDLDANARADHLKKMIGVLGPTRMMNLTEFGRPVHAEMEAILGAGRIGVGCRSSNLYTTTFPCHNCAKHLVAAGIRRVVYIEPYPKSLAVELHGDSIRFADEEPVEDHRVSFESFVGVAPRRFAALFAMALPHGAKYPRKDRDGRPMRAELGLRTSVTGLNYTQREAVAAMELAEFVASEQQEFDFGQEEDLSE